MNDIARVTKYARDDYKIPYNDKPEAPCPACDFYHWPWDDCLEEPANND